MRSKRKKSLVKYRIKLRIAGISMMILAVLIASWPMIVRAAEDTTWQNDFQYTLDDPAFQLEGEAHTITLNRYLFPSGVTDLVVPKYAVINGVEYRTCLGNSHSGGVFGEPWHIDREIKTLDLSNVDTSKTTSMENLFASLDSVEKINLSNFDTSNVTDMNSMFHSCRFLNDIDISFFDTSQVTLMTNMFYGCRALTALDISGWDTSKVESMTNMFSNCMSLESINMTGIDTSNVRSMSAMFDNCQKLKELNLASLDTSKVEYMGHMFAECINLEYLDLSNFNTEKVIDMNGLLYNCSRLKSVDLSSFDTSKTRELYSLISGCSSLTQIDLSNFDYSYTIYGDGLDYAHRFMFDDTSLDIIKTPVNVPTSFHIPLYDGDYPATFRDVITNEEYTELPTGRSDSITLVRYNSADVQSVGLNQTSISGLPDQTYQLVATVRPITATDKSVIWSSADESIATVDSNGLVTFVSPGVTWVTVTTNDGGFTATCRVTVDSVDDRVDGVTLNESSIILNVGDTFQLVETISPSTASNKVVAWTSSDPSIASVDSTGLVTANAVGEADIHVITSDGGFTATCHVTVIPSSIPVTGISVTPSTLSMEVGDTSTLSISITPDNATNQNVTFTSNNSAVATVDDQGVVTAVSPGGAAITVTTEDGGLTDTCIVVVTERATPTVDVTGVSVSPKTLSMTVGDTDTLTATVLPSNATNKTVSYASSNPSVATVDANGFVTAVSPGNTTITVTTADGGKTDTCIVTVTAAPDPDIPVTGVTLSPHTLSMTTGETSTLTTTVAPANATNKDVTYASSNPRVATVDENGIVTALSAGNTVITVTTADAGKTDICNVTVTDAPSPAVLTVIDNRTDADHTNRSAAAVTSLTEPLTLLISSTAGTSLRAALPEEDEIDQVSTFRLEMKNASGADTTSYGVCTVSMPLPMNFLTDSGSLKLYYLNTNGVLDTVDDFSISTTSDGTKLISFQAPAMTEYALAHSKKEAEPVTPNPPDDSGDGGQTTPPVININIPDINVNVTPPEINVAAPDVTVTSPDVSVTTPPVNVTVNTPGTVTGTSGYTTTTYNASDMPRTGGGNYPYRMIVVSLLFMAGTVMTVLSIDTKKLRLRFQS